MNVKFDLVRIGKFRKNHSNSKVKKYVYKKTIQGGYLLEDETPRQAYRRVAKTEVTVLESSYKT